MQPLFTPRQIYTVSELASQIKKLNERSFSLVWLRGEISGFSKAASGHCYFTLTDGQAGLRAVMFRHQASLLRFAPADGLKVLCRGTVSLYSPKGELQFLAESLEPAGQGEEALALARLKQRLAAQGWFAQERKRPLPLLAERIALITSPQGAALHDFLKVLQDKPHGMEIKIMPSLMQGQAALPALLNLLEELKNSDWPQVVVISRGGGSNQDLSLFNQEALALALGASPAPVLTAVGHEIDVSVCDLVADLRAATPTAAAQILLAPWLNWHHKLGQLSQRLRQIIEGKLHLAGLRLTTLKLRLRHPGQKLTWQRQRLIYSLSRLNAAGQRRLAGKAAQCEFLRLRLARVSPAQILEARRQSLTRLLVRARAGQKSRLIRQEKQWQAAQARLKALNPLTILARGYALVRDEQGIVIRDSRQVRPGQGLEIRLARGEIKAQVKGLSGILSTDEYP
jgi:exodeoxyribonuclease VII large subunit